MDVEGSKGNVPEAEKKFSPPVLKRRTLLFILLGIVLLLIGLFVFSSVRLLLSQRGVDKAVQEWDRLQEEKRAAQMADIYGGKTPQETLSMFIEAMEKENYELASKYFEIDSQEEKLDEIKAAPKEEIEKTLGLLKKMQLDDKDVILGKMYEIVTARGEDAGSKEDYIEREKAFYTKSETMSVAVGDGRSSVSFTLYPNGIWKIERM